MKRSWWMSFHHRIFRTVGTCALVLHLSPTGHLLLSTARLSSWAPLVHSWASLVWLFCLLLFLWLHTNMFSPSLKASPTPGPAPSPCSLYRCWKRDSYSVSPAPHHSLLNPIHLSFCPYFCTKTVLAKVAHGPMSFTGLISNTSSVSHSIHLVLGLPCSAGSFSTLYWLFPLSSVLFARFLSPCWPLAYSAQGPNPLWSHPHSWL